MVIYPYLLVPVVCCIMEIVISPSPLEVDDVGQALLFIPTKLLGTQVSQIILLHPILLIYSRNMTYIRTESLNLHYILLSDPIF